MQGIDIRPLKMRLRGEIKAWRRAREPGWKAAADEKICARVLALREYAACSTLLTYVSLPIEVDTLRLISHAFAAGKRVAAPRCVEGTHAMEFYEISSMDDLARQRNAGRLTRDLLIALVDHISVSEGGRITIAFRFSPC